MRESVPEPTGFRAAGEQRLPSAVQTLPSVAEVLSRTRTDHPHSSSGCDPARCLWESGSGSGRTLANPHDVVRPLAAGYLGVWS
jgi:hypothetical protein